MTPIRRTNPSPNSTKKTSRNPNPTLEKFPKDSKWTDSKPKEKLERKKPTLPDYDPNYEHTFETVTPGTKWPIKKEPYVKDDG